MKTTGSNTFKHIHVLYSINELSGLYLYHFNAHHLNLQHRRLQVILAFTQSGQPSIRHQRKEGQHHCSLES